MGQAVRADGRRVPLGAEFAVRQVRREVGGSPSRLFRFWPFHEHGGELDVPLLATAGRPVSPEVEADSKAAQMLA